MHDLLRNKSIGSRGSKILQKLNHPLLPTFLFTGLISFLIYQMQPWPFTFLESLGLLGAGLLFWTLLEYTFHRFLAHLSNQPQGWQKFFSAAHNKHHQKPESRFLLILNPILSLGLWFILLGLLTALLSSFAAAKVIMAGVGMGYIFYEWVHYGAHYYRWKSTLGRYYQKLHFYHHFKSSKQAFGVTSPLWDYIFRTQRSS